MQNRGVNVRHTTPMMCPRGDRTAWDSSDESPLIPVHNSIERFTRSGPKLFADGVGDGDHGRLHDVVVWDSEQLRGLALVGEVECCPASAQSPGASGEH